MPVTREARYLSGVDIGKTVEVTELAKFGNSQQQTGELISVRHYNDSTDVLITTSRGPTAIQIDPTDTVTITGKAS